MTSIQTRTPKPAATNASEPEVTVEGAVEHAKRAFALRKFEQAVEHYAIALELM
jgi:HAT1-interacting factor 1